MNTLATEVLADGHQVGETVLPLSSTELAALAESESVIRNGNESIVGIFVRQGKALQRIMDSRLYRGKYRTFEEYCPAEFEFSDRHARSLMRATDIFEVLQTHHFGLLPKTESQARPLSKLPREEWAPAWQEVMETAPAGKIRANHVAEVVRRRLNRLKPSAPAPEVLEARTKQESQDVAAPAGFMWAIVPVKPLGLPTPLQPAVPDPTIIDVPDLSTREKRIRDAANEAAVKLLALHDLIGTADGVAAANVVLSIQNLDELRDHLSRKEEMLSSRAVAVEGVRL